MVGKCLGEEHENTSQKKKESMPWILFWWIALFEVLAFVQSILEPGQPLGGGIG